jgi:hypothetical protein
VGGKLHLEKLVVAQLLKICRNGIRRVIQVFGYVTLCPGYFLTFRNDVHCSTRKLTAIKSFLTSATVYQLTRSNVTVHSILQQLMSWGTSSFASVTVHIRTHKKNTGAKRNCKMPNVHIHAPAVSVRAETFTIFYLMWLYPFEEPPAWRLQSEVIVSL